MTDLGYSTEWLIDRLYAELEKESTNKTNKKLIMEHPIVTMQNRKSFFANFRSICKNICRPELDVKQFFDAELACGSTIDSNGVMVISGKFRAKNIEKVLINYLTIYVFCKECSSNKTDIIKKDRIPFLKCNKCLSEKAINN